MIQRFLEDKVAKSILKYPVVAILGPRQVGKTTLAKQVQKVLPKPSEYLDLELSSDATKLRDAEIYLKRFGGATVILDEIQRMPELFPLLRALVDQDRQPGRFVILGSASPELLLKSAESLAGRIAYFELPPILFAETGYEHYEEHWFRGGFPQALLAESQEDAQDWLHQFVKTYVERDLPMLGFPGSPVVAENTLKMAASLHGQLLNYSFLANSLGLNATTVHRYLDFFEQAFLIRRLLPFHYRVSKRLVKSPKVYVRDSGVLHVLSEMTSPNRLFGHVILGASWEGYVIEQIVQSLKSQYRPYFYRTADGSEIDLVVANGVEPVATFEIKFSNSPSLTKGYYLALNDLGTRHNFVVTPEAGDYPLKENIEVCNIATLLDKLRDLGLSFW